MYLFRTSAQSILLVSTWKRKKKQKAPFSEEIKYFYNLSGNFHRKKKTKMEKEN